MAVERIRKLFEIDEIPVINGWISIAEREQYRVDTKSRNIHHEFHYSDTDILNIRYSDTGITITSYNFRENLTTMKFEWKLHEMMDEAEYFQLCTVDDTFGIEYTDYLEMLKQYSRIMTWVRENMVSKEPPRPFIF